MSLYIIKDGEVVELNGGYYATELEAYKALVASLKGEEQRLQGRAAFRRHGRDEAAGLGGIVRGAITSMLGDGLDGRGLDKG